MKATISAPVNVEIEIVEEVKAATTWIVNVEEQDKTFLSELQSELGLRSSKEVISVLLKVATDSRFLADGSDRFEEASQVLIKGRAKAKAMSQLEKTKAKLAELMALMEA
jgi:hypothetical protein